MTRFCNNLHQVSSKFHENDLTIILFKITVLYEYTGKYFSVEINREIICYLLRSAFRMFHCIVYDFTVLFEIKQISFPFWSRHFYTTKLKTLKTSNKFYLRLKKFTNYKTKTTFNYTKWTVIRLFGQELQFTLIACTLTCKNNKHRQNHWRVT